MYADLIKRKFPHDQQLDLYVQPQLPAVKLGKALAKDTRVASPSDIVAVHMYGGMFSSSLVIFTTDKCFFTGGSFLLEDVREATFEGKTLIVTVNQGGAPTNHKIGVKNEDVARVLRKLFSDIAYFDAKSVKHLEKTYENLGYNKEEINWLKLRDEVMRTIDMLTERFNDGKLSLLQFEEKKDDLLSRL